MSRTTHDANRAESAPVRWSKQAWPTDLYPPRHPLLIVLSGPSGVGKDAVIAALKDEHFPLHYTVTATTRPPRPNEVPGVSYHFLSPAEFAALRESNGLLESANVHGYEYGTPAEQVRQALRDGWDTLLKIDVQGAAQIRSRVSGAVFIFLGPPSVEELVSRLNRRGTEKADYLETRIRNAQDELRAVADYDYVVINREGRAGLAEAVAEVKAIIQAERLRVRSRECDLG